MKKSKFEKQMKEMLKAARHDPLIGSIGEKRKFDIINNIKRIFDEEMTIRKVMKKELFQVSFYSMVGKILNVDFLLSSLIDRVDEKTSEKFILEYHEFIKNFVTNAVSGKAVVGFAASVRNKGEWSFHPSISIAIPREGRSVETMLKTFNRLQNFQDTFEIASQFDIGLLPYETSDDTPEAGNGYVLHRFGPLALSAFEADERNVTITFRNFFDHIYMMDMNIPEDVDAITYKEEMVEKFDRENRPAKTLDGSKDKKHHDKKDK